MKKDSIVIILIISVLVASVASKYFDQVQTYLLLSGLAMIILAMAIGALFVIKRSGAISKTATVRAIESTIVGFISGWVVFYAQANLSITQNGATIILYDPIKIVFFLLFFLLATAAATVVASHIDKTFN